MLRNTALDDAATGAGLLLNVRIILPNYFLHIKYNKHKFLIKANGTAIPLQGWTGTQGTRRFRLPEFQDNRHMKVVILSALRTGRLYPHEISMVLICVRGYVDPMGNSAAGKITSTKKSQRPHRKSTSRHSDL